MPRLRTGALLWGGALGLMVGACLEPPRYTCMLDAECMLNNVQGICDVPTTTCMYMTPACPSGWRDGHGTCVVPTNLPTTTDVTSVSEGQNDEDTSSSGSSGEDSAGTTYTPVECDMGSGDITSEGSVSASTENVMLMYSAEQAVDGSVATSWFSTGPEAGGMPTTFRWALVSERCITGVEIEGNAMHPERSEGWGFGQVTVKVLDVQSTIIFQRTIQLPGSPDPHVSVDTEGVVGNRVLLEFQDHENPTGGGFSELNVYGQ